MDKNRYSKWIDNSQNLKWIDIILIGEAQGLGKLDVELIEEFSKLKINSRIDKERIAKNRHMVLSQLWVMGAYELIRLINEIIKMQNKINCEAKLKLKEVLTIFTEIRIPLTKFKKSGKTKLYSQVTWPYYDSKKGIGWKLIDGKSKTKIIYRKDLGDSLLELLKQLKFS